MYVFVGEEPLNEITSDKLLSSSYPRAHAIYMKWKTLFMHSGRIVTNLETPILRIAVDETFTSLKNNFRAHFDVIFKHHDQSNVHYYFYAKTTVGDVFAIYLKSKILNFL